MSFNPLCFSGASEINMSVDVGLKNDSIYAVIRLYLVNVSVQVHVCSHNIHVPVPACVLRALPFLKYIHVYV